MGDETGGSGWEIVTPDGKIEKYYVDLPRPGRYKPAWSCLTRHNSFA